MIETSLRLPRRAAKPRRSGITMVIDSGLPVGYFTDVVESNGALIDVVKFGWGTALVTASLETKIAVLREHGVGYYFGGTLFEKHVRQDRFDEFRALCHAFACPFVEVSNGTIDLSNSEKAAYIGKLSEEFSVLSEVGFKDPRRSERLEAAQWVDHVQEDLGAGAYLVTTESRESGRSGTCRPDGRLRVDLIEELLGAVGPEVLLFEAPTAALQAQFVSRVGPDVNLGNISPSDVVALETLRLGLRSDTLERFD
ncbi:MAG: phosphosulfolactate synthase [Acidimicrobiales bacterium]|nr:phosphosulfolactate synthase [Acidimicrobiales bacterium]MBO0886200.1 phosphosulfolactate synthase [Acidimicrobiales bacterium]MBO0893457.1 phosphosulfolactate synthase [Acidimicrobiales bacterium]